MLPSWTRIVVLFLLLLAGLTAFAPAGLADPPGPGDADGEPVAEAPREAGGSSRQPLHAVVRDGNTEAISFMLLAVLLGFSAFAVLLLTAALAPEATATLIAQAPGSFPRRLLVGAANVLFIFVAIKISRNLLAIPMVPFLVVLFVLGLLVLCEEVGRRIERVAGREGNRLARMGAGWSVLYLAAWFPVIGWFVVAPVLALTAVGTTMLWLLTRRAKPMATAETAPTQESKPAGSDVPTGV